MAALEPLLENWLVAVVISRAVPHGRHWLRNRKQASATVPGDPSLFGERQGLPIDPPLPHPRSTAEITNAVAGRLPLST